jgi:hypothetical protein
MPPTAANNTDRFAEFNLEPSPCCSQDINRTRR